MPLAAVTNPNCCECMQCKKCTAMTSDEHSHSDQVRCSGNNVQIARVNNIDVREHDVITVKKCVHFKCFEIHRIICSNLIGFLSMQCIKSLIRIAFVRIHLMRIFHDEIFIFIHPEFIKLINNTIKFFSSLE